MLIDSHAHLMFPEFKDDLENVLARAREAGVEKIINVGCDIKSSRQAVEMAKANRENRLAAFGGNDFLYATLGLHPYDALDISDELLKEWEKLIREDRESGRKKIVAIGETGLDYVKSTVDKQKQQESFRCQLRLAVKAGLPVIVHNRGADEDCLGILKSITGDTFSAQKHKFNAVFHCFGSNLEFARKVWEAGFMTSFTGIVTYPSARELREVVKEVPLDKFMVETDCPYLAPQAYRGKRNEPAYVVETAKMIAEAKSMELTEVEKLAVENSKRFFKF